MKVAKAVTRLIESFERLPAIGPKTAARLTYYLLHVPQGELDQFAQALSQLKTNTVLCSLCFNVSETDPCPVCSDPSRDKATICVVEQPLDVVALDKTGKYQGVYHVLHGAISPLANIGPDELYIKDLLKRITNHQPPITEVILATNPNMEGEATAMYINRVIKGIKDIEDIKVSRLGLGLPTGGDIEYADELTLSRALEGRREY